MLEDADLDDDLQRSRAAYSGVIRPRVPLAHGHR
jgi:hypothetical protein